MRILPTTMALAALAGVVGITAGVGGFTFLYADGAAYLTDDPAACNNCHVMREEYEGWSKGPHHQAAVCNDCHTPTGFFAKYLAKALNGYHHSRAFTLGDFHEPIRIGERNRAVTEAQCRRCHGELASMIEGPHAGGEATSCLRCHSSVGHLR
ncbi:MAG: cytochrome c nitrite reductase small subunit [Deltaproteobacteria bacterium]|nr:cytochrome c nitrite reductase small subunit [Deltaproteobacteria bacterium]